MRIGDNTCLEEIKSIARYPLGRVTRFADDAHTLGPFAVLPENSSSDLRDAVNGFLNDLHQRIGDLRNAVDDPNVLQKRTADSDRDG